MSPARKAASKIHARTFRGRTVAEGALTDLVDALRAVNESLILASVRETELAEERERQAANLSGLLSNLDEGVLIADSSGEIILANPLARKLLSFAEHRSLSVSDDWARLTMLGLDGKSLPATDRPLLRALRGESFVGEEVCVDIPDRGEFRLSFTSGVVRDDNGEVTLAILIFRDVTEVRRLEQQREEYLSLISHDLRTPLTVIRGRAEWLAHLARRDGQAQFVSEADAIVRNSQRMEAMLEDLLDTSRFEAGRAVLRQRRLDLGELVQRVVNDVIPREMGNRIYLRVAPSLPSVFADPERLERVSINLLTNALKFSPKLAPVDVAVEAVDSDVVVRVTDHGVGIAPEDQSKVFERYFQTATGARREGHGLGLYLSRLIVEASGGRIGVTSEVGKGSTFQFSVPCEPGAA